MTTLISILIVLVSLALILVVIVQKSKGGGLAATFSGANSIVGVRKATDGIEKTTWYLIASLMVLCIAYTRFAGTAIEKDTIQEKLEQKANSVATPSIPAVGAKPAAPAATPQTTPAEAAPASTPATPEAAPAPAQN